jgi:phosphoglycolate phosphatase
MAPLSLVLFDIDGTLLNSGGSGRRAMSQAAGELFGRPDLFDGLSFAGAVDSSIVALALESAHLPPTPRRVGRLRARYTRRLIRGLKAHKGEACPGVRAAVEAVRLKAEVGLLTGNWREAARVKLATHGLSDLFDGCVGAYGGDAMDRNHLVPVAVHRACRRWGEVSRVIVVGDTPADVRCAQAGAAVLTGIQVISVAVETGFASPDELRASGPDHQVQDLVSGLSTLLAQL